MDPLTLVVAAPASTTRRICALRRGLGTKNLRPLAIDFSSPRDSEVPQVAYDHTVDWSAVCELHPHLLYNSCNADGVTIRRLKRMPGVTVRTQSGRFCFGIATLLLLGPAGAEPLTRAEVAAKITAEKADLSNLEAPGADLSGLDFKGANLFGASFKGANLTRAKLRGCNLDVAILRDATLTGADLHEVSLYSSVLANAKADGSDLSGSRLMANMDRVSLVGADLSDVKGGSDMGNQPMGLVRLILTHARLQKAKLNRADLSRADLSFADLREADLSDANLTFAKLSGADLTGAKFDRATLTGAEIHNANFTDAKGLDTVHGLETTEGRELAVFGPSR
ncbi:MAG TPA: pentapeptide repeat-containing protein [Steroidobacteraceae bacterium]|nr:pentapeptide repeat-containing protein [Steroidobacteraceae bacterium]